MITSLNTWNICLELWIWFTVMLFLPSGYTDRIFSGEKTALDGRNRVLRTPQFLVAPHTQGHSIFLALAAAVQAWQGQRLSVTKESKVSDSVAAGVRWCVQYCLDERRELSPLWSCVSFQYSQCMIHSKIYPHIKFNCPVPFLLPNLKTLKSLRVSVMLLLFSNFLLPALNVATHLLMAHSTLAAVLHASARISN